MYQRGEAGFGQGGGAATLALQGALPRSFGTRDFGATLAEIPLGWRGRLADLDLVVDLGSRIGSREWWRGLATCTLLCGATLALAPGFTPLIGSSPAPLPEAQWQQARALAISPLAYGADTGRRMGSTDAVEPLVGTPERPRIDLTATLGQGDGFARVLERAGVGEQEAQTIADMVGGAVTLGEIAPGTRIDLTLGRRPNKSVARPLDELAFRARFDLKLAVHRLNGALALQQIPIAVDDTPLRIRGRVGSSLYISARAAGAPGKAVEAYLKALSARMAIGRDVHADDQFDIIVEHRRAETGETETGNLLYAGLDQGRKKTRLLKWTSGGQTQFFEASGVGETRGGMTRPVIGHETSAFGMRRHPILGFSRFHKGMDIGAPYGSPIVAVTDGVVSYAGRHGGHGNYVKLEHAGGLATGYAHMSRIIARLGAHVRQGELIGYVGSTGLSTGPHLHYEVYKNGEPVNPATMTFTTRALLAGRDLVNFRAKLANLLAIKPGAATPKAEASVKSAETAEHKSKRG